MSFSLAEIKDADISEIHTSHNMWKRMAGWEFEIETHWGRIKATDSNCYPKKVDYIPLASIVTIRTQPPRAAEMGVKNVESGSAKAAKQRSPGVQ